MRPILLDTNAYTAFKRGESSIVEILQTAPTIGMSTIVLGELLSGFDCGKKTQKNREELHKFLSSSRIRIFQVGTDTANFYAHIYAKLKINGRPIPTNDMWIAAQTLEHGCVLCSLDKHFALVEGLIVVSTLFDLVV